MSDFELFDQHPIPTWIYSTRTLRFLAVNEAAIQSYGYSREQFSEMTIEQIRPREDVARLRYRLEYGPMESEPLWRHLKSDGTCIEVNVDSRPIVFRGEPARIVAIRNVSPQVSDLQRLNLALSAGKFAVWEYDLIHGTLTWDPTRSGVYGIDRSLFPTTQEEFLKLVEPDFRESLDDAFKRCVGEGAPYDCEFKLNMPGIGVRWRHAIGKRINDPAGNPIKIIGIGIDITDKKKLEEQVHRSQKLEAVGRLASGIAHDFNNILTVISGYSHLLSHGDESTFVADAANEICIASDRAARLVKQLLDFSRTVPEDPKPVELSQMVRESLGLIRRLMPESIVIDLKVTEESLQVSADPGQVEQLIMNLCLNARDAMSDGGQLTITIAAEGSFAKIVIEDTGTGITADVQHRMFEPFFTTKEVGAGSGLGLSIVHSIVNQLRGSIDVQSIAGQGSIFSIYLPLT